MGFEEITRFIPTSNNLPPNLIPSLQWVAIGLLIVIFLWVRPQGILPERKRVIIGACGRAADGGSAGGGQRQARSGAVTASRAARAGQRRPLVARRLRMRPPGGAAARRGRWCSRRSDVVREFGGVRAVAGVSFQVRQGTLTGLIGPNGAGKSTLLAMLAGTLPVTSGTIIYEGRDVTGMPAFRRARLGLVRTFQLASEFKRLTVMENLLSAVPRQPRGHVPRRPAREALLAG